MVLPEVAVRHLLPLVLAVSAAAVAPSPRPPGADRAESPAFTLAVMRRDGVMVPFAQYDGRRWQNRWPTPFTRTDVPISLSSVPKDWWGKVPAGTGWTLYPSAGDPRPVRITAPHLFSTHCVANVGLQTDYRSSQALPLPFVHHHPKDGLVVAGDLQIEPIEALRTDMPAWDALLDQVTQHADAIEARAEGDWSWQGARAFFNRKTRVGIPVSVEVICRTPGITPGTFVHYFEAVRRYAVPKRREQTASDFTAVSQGFVLPGRPLRLRPIRAVARPHSAIKPTPSTSCRSAPSGWTACCTGPSNGRRAGANGTPSSGSDRRRSPR